MTERDIHAGAFHKVNLPRLRDVVFMALLSGETNAYSPSKFSSIVTNEIRASLSRYNWGGAGLQSLFVNLNTNDWLLALSSTTNNKAVPKATMAACLIQLSFTDENGENQHLALLTDGSILNSNLVGGTPFFREVFRTKP